MKSSRLGSMRPWTKDKAQPSCPRSKTGELHRIVDSVRLNLREAEGPSTEMPQARRGSKIDWTSAAKDALLWVPAGGHGHPVKHLGLASRCAGFGSCERQFRRREPTEPKRCRPFP